MPKITAYPALTDPVGADLLPIVDDAAGTPTTKKVLLSALLALVWPIGSVFTAVVSTNPATLLGFGTWVAFGAGRVLVGIDPNDADFNVVEETGGAKTVTLTTTEIPAHNHQILRERSATTGAATTQIARTADTTSTVDAAVFTENTGGGGAHQNMPPYIVVYRWVRTG